MSQRETQVRRDARALEFVRKLAGLTKTERKERAERDKQRYHPANPKDYGSTVGMPIDNSKGKVIGYACVGCWWCCPDEARTHEPEARAILRAAGEDY